ncbi:MAG: 4a-hydroxytetrahydrobiopterin dehydratase [Planctomycetota bacterium]|jgi:4a-hydroxytetrahydrobiopterin dehydratase
MKQLDAAAVESELARLDGWSLDGAKLHKTYTFPDFVEAFAFMTRVAVLAEEQDHHPEWRNVYRTVEVHLTTHDAGGISERDFRLARSMDLAVAT